MRAVGGKDGGAYVSADLCSAQRTWSAAALLPFQRGRRAIPARMPALHSSPATRNCVAGSERGEAASGVVWRVLEEDVMLGLGAEMRHGVAVLQPSECRGLNQRSPREGTKTGFFGAATPTEQREEMVQQRGRVSMEERMYYSSQRRLPTRVGSHQVTAFKNVWQFFWRPQYKHQHQLQFNPIHVPTVKGQLPIA